MKTAELKTSEKFKYLITVTAVTAAYILGVKYILPLFWPFVPAAILSVLIHPIVIFLKKYLHLGRGIASAIVLTIIIGIISALIFLAIWYVFDMIKGFIYNREIYGRRAYNYLCGMCEGVENAFGMEEKKLAKTVIDKCAKGLDNYFDGLADSYVGGGFKVIGIVADTLVVFSTLYVATIMFAKDMKKIKDGIKKSVFGKEIFHVVCNVKNVFSAYFRAQVIIMMCTCVICVIVLYAAGQEYPVFWGMVTGLLDALPMIGVGIILVPWSIVMIAMENYTAGIIIFIGFLLSSVAREMLEPKLIGGKMGMPPIITLMALYIGYKLFGLIGFVLGPAGYIIIKSISEVILDKNSNPE